MDLTYSYRHRALQAERSTLMQKYSAEVQEATAGLDRSSTEAREKSAAVYAKYKDEITAFANEAKALKEKTEKLAPGPQRKSFVWVYERK